MRLPRERASRLNCAGCLGACGLFLLAVGAALILTVEAIIRQGVKDFVVIDTESKYDDRLKSVDRPYDVHLWNCTNLKAVLDGDEPRPRFESVFFEMRYLEENYAFDFQHNREILEFKSWWVVVPKNDDEARRLNETTIVNVNAVYLVSVASFGATETNLFAGLSYLVVQQVDALLTQYVDSLRGLLLPGYLSAVTTGLPLQQTAERWQASTCPNATLDEALQIWNASSPVSVVNPVTYNEVWLPAVLSSGQEDDDDAVAACLRETSYSEPYVRWVFPQENNLTSWDLVKGAQFGSGFVTRTMLDGAPSVLSLELDGVIVAPEIFAAFDVELTPSEGVEFLRVFSNTTLSLDFVSTALFGDPFSLLVDPVYVATGLTLTNAFDFLEYIYTYLPESFFLAGLVVGKIRDPETSLTDPRGILDGSLSLRDDGTGVYNSGLFTRRPARDFLFGYDDRIFEVLPPSLTQGGSYSGVLGVQYANIEEQERRNPSLIYRVTTGKRAIQKMRQYELWRNITDVDARTSLPSKDGSSWPCDTWESQGYESCLVWRAPFTMRNVPYRQVGPFHESGTKRAKKRYTLWSTEVMRPVKFEFDHQVKVKGLTARRYRVRPISFWTANCTLEPTRCHPDNAVYRMDSSPSFIAPMASTTGGGKSSVSYPAFGRMEERWRAQTEGMPDFVQRTMDTFVDVEPLTGLFIKGHLRLQYNSDLDDRQLTSKLWVNLFGNNNPNVTDHILYWPLLWFDDNDVIDGDDARAFKRWVYRPRLLAKVFTGLSLVIGVACLGAAVLVARSASAGVSIKGAPCVADVKQADVELVATDTQTADASASASSTAAAAARPTTTGDDEKADGFDPDERDVERQGEDPPRSLSP